MSRYRIGRAETNDIVLADPTVSREHAELVELGEGRFQVKDLGSTYGVSVMQGAEWQKVTEAELGHDSRLRIGDFETTVAELLRSIDRTVVRPHAPPRLPEATAPPADAPAVPDQATSPPAPARTAAPKPAPPRPAPPRPAPPRPAAPARSTPSSENATPRPPAPAFQFLGNVPPEKRILVWLGVGFAAFLLIALVTLILALAL